MRTYRDLMIYLLQCKSEVLDQDILILNEEGHIGYGVTGHGFVTTEGCYVWDIDKGLIDKFYLTVNI